MVDDLFFLDESEKSDYKILEDKFIHAYQKVAYVETDFLDPFWQEMAKSIANSYNELSVSFLGGKKDAERAVCVIYKSFLKEPVIDDYISVLSFENYVSDIRHKDILGKLMSLGIKREAIGDIVVGQESCFFVIKKSLESFLLSEFREIRKHKIHLFKVQVEDIEACSNRYRQENIVTPSLRADALVTNVYKIKRTLASNLIKQGMLKVNYRVFDRPDKKIELPSMMSLRGKGRVYLEQIQGHTQKDNYKISIRRMIDK